MTLTDTDTGFECEAQTHVAPVVAIRIPSSPRDRVSLQLCEALPQKAEPQLHGCTCEKCKPLYKSLKRHPRDTPLSIQLQGFGFRKHDTWHLATLAVASFATKTQITRWGQLRALSDFRAWWRFGHSANAKRMRTMDLRVVHRRIFVALAEMMNQIFFLGSLPAAKLRVEWAIDSPALSYGVTHFDWSTPTPYAHIAINPEMVYHKLNPSAVICTLLHEMTHAFLGLYSCTGGKGSACGSELCKQLGKDIRGKTGHGRAWQHITKAIEDRLPDILGFAGRLGRQECAVQEIQTFGFRPSDCDMKALHGEITVAVQVRKRKWFDDGDVELKAATQEQKAKDLPKRAKRRRWSIGACKNLRIL
ncbi:hypothetical protein LTR08_000331 [Meristemomyces frigidus]|nr:hypothetical protein LTR08_000331 [Meristemomyces frigidus]